MRLSILAAAACLVTAACGGPETSQANNVQANVSNDSRTAVQAVGSSEKSSGTAPGNAAVFAGPVSGADATRIMHQRHEGMETMGKTAKTIKGQLDSFAGATHEDPRFRVDHLLSGTPSVRVLGPSAPILSPPPGLDGSGELALVRLRRFGRSGPIYG